MIKYLGRFTPLGLLGVGIQLVSIVLYAALRNVLSPMMSILFALLFSASLGLTLVSVSWRWRNWCFGGVLTLLFVSLFVAYSYRPIDYLALAYDYERVGQVHRKYTADVIRASVGNLEAGAQYVNTLAANERLARYEVRLYLNVLGQVGVDQRVPLDVLKRVCGQDSSQSCYRGIALRFAQSTPHRNAQEVRELCAQLDYMPPEACAQGVLEAFSLDKAFTLERALVICGAFSEPTYEKCITAAFETGFGVALDRKEAGLPQTFIRLDEPLYPCNEMAQVYVRACFNSRLEVFAYIYRDDWEQIGAACQSEPEDYRKGCYYAIGSRLGNADISNGATANCGKLPQEGQQICLKALGEVKAQTPAATLTPPPTQPPTAMQIPSHVDTLLLAPLLSTSKTSGLDPALVQLSKLSKANVAVARSDHDFAHALGAEAFTRTSNPLLAQQGLCQRGFNFGCFHGVVEAYTLSHPARTPLELSRDCETIFHDNGTFPDTGTCWHALGHAFAQQHLPDYLRAIELCSMLPNDLAKGVCGAGVFMERLGGASGMGHGPIQKGVLQVDDPTFPCSKTPNYASPCYLVQGMGLAEALDHNWKAAASACAKVPDAYQRDCYRGLGFAAFLYEANVEASRADCLLTGAGKEDCLIGVVTDLRLPWTEVVKVCKELTNNDRLGRCYFEASRAIAYSDLADKRLEACATLPPGYAPSCRELVGRLPQ